MKRNRRLSPPDRQQVLVDALEPRRLLSTSHHFYSGFRPHPIPSAKFGAVVLQRSGPSKGAKAGASPNNSSGPVGFSPTQISHAYGFDNVKFNNNTTVGNGAGQTVAIIDAYYDPNIVSDLHQFDTQFGLADPTFNVIDQNGIAINSSHHPNTDPAGPGNSWALEQTLDVEWVHAMAPQAAIVLVETNDANFLNLIENAAPVAAARAGVSVVSMSFGASEWSQEGQLDSFMTTPGGHQGVTFVVSTGDSGSPAEYPAVAPNVVALGGTSLTLAANGDYSSEAGWSGSGGGLSTYESQPAYQNGIVTQSSTQRAAPDVAMDANPNTGVAVYDSWDNSSLPWAQVGGTSLSAPLFSGLLAVANQGRAAHSLGTLDGVNDTLPKLYSAPASLYHDITTGKNPLHAGPGYDLVTGRGSPLADQLIAYLAQPANSSGYTMSQSGNLTLQRDADGVHSDVYVNGTLTQQLLLSQSTSFTLTGTSGNDTFTFDFSHGDPLPTAGATVDGLAGANTVAVIGTANNDTVTAGISSVTFTGGSLSNVPVSVNNIQGVSFAGGSGGSDTLTISGATRQISADTPSGTPNVAVNVQSGATATFTGDQHLAALTIDNASASLPPTAALLAIAGGLTITNGGFLNVTRGEFTVNATATPMSTIQNYLSTGYNHGAWNGAGIISTAITAANRTAVGYVNGTGSNGAAAGDLLVAWALQGDTTLKGSVGLSDYNTLAANFNKAGGWAQGDFDYDGSITLNDYNLLAGDFNNTLS